MKATIDYLTMAIRELDGWKRRHDSILAWYEEKEIEEAIINLSQAVRLLKTLQADAAL